MARAFALCIEDLDAPEESERFLLCTATPRGEGGLALDGTGAVVWRSVEARIHLAIDAEERPVVERSPGAPMAVLRRAGRSTDIEEGDPVLLLDRDELELEDRRLRVHLHGPVSWASAPAPFPAPGPPPQEPAPPPAIRSSPPAPPPMDGREGAGGGTGREAVAVDLIVRHDPPAPPPRPPGPGRRGLLFWLVTLALAGGLVFVLYRFFLRG